MAINPSSAKDKFGESNPLHRGNRKLIDFLIKGLLGLIIQVSVLGLVDIVSSGFEVKTLGAAVIFVIILGLVNSFLLAPLMSLSIRMHPLLFPIMIFFLNGVLVEVLGNIVPGISISSIWTAIGVSLAITMTGVIVGVMFAADDFKAYERFVIQPLIERYKEPTKSDIPGIVFLEIDGLSQAVFEKAIHDGYMPYVKKWLDSGSHKIVGWETDLSCQTGASQPGILHGNNFNIPAFRWYEKDKRKLLTSEKPRDVAEVERRISNGKGLLVNNGASRANMYSGDATESILTVSTIGATKRNTMEYFLFYANPYMAARTFGLFLSHFVTEVLEGWLQMALNERPRVYRAGFFPFQRATTTAILRELGIFSLIGDMLRGLPSMYATFVGYDEVAHHSGVARKDSLRVLAGLDKTFEWLELVSVHAARPYKFVILSDHGQSNGSTFLQRTGTTLEQAVKDLSKLDTISPASQDETWLRINALLTDVSRQGTTTGKLVNRAVKNKTHDGTVMLGPRTKQMSIEKDLEAEERNKAIVLASGNLGLIYFTAWKDRMTLEQINQAFPNLIPGLLKYRWVGFVLVHSETQGGLIFGSKGVYHLDKNTFEGENPLANFGANAALHLKREDSFSNAPDILINSFYDTKMDEVAAFEELVGSHGGLGGNQSKAILVHPSELKPEPIPIVGASELHKILKSWTPDR
jgi:putative membrane protein